MMRRGIFTLLVLLTPTVAWAQAGPDRVLPSGSQVYLSWDGFAPHRAAYEKTALGMTMKGELGQFLAALWTYGMEALETAAGLADPNAPEFIREANNILASIGQNGFALGIEARGINPPDAQGVLVFPKSGPTMLPMVTKLTALARVNIKEAKVGKRTVYSIADNNSPVQFGWWSEGDDAVFVVGTQDPEAYAKRIDSNETGLANHPVRKKLAGYKDFPVWARAYIDTAGIFKTVAAAYPPAGTIIGDLGLKGLDSVTFVSGFDGPAERAITDINFTGPRKGLLALINKKTFTLNDLPPLPSDVTGFSASNFNLKSLYDGGVQVADVALQAIQGVDVKEAIKQIEAIIDVNLGEDLFGTFDGMAVNYSSPSEGPLGLGSVVMLKVKNEEKLLKSLDTIFGKIPALPFVEVTYQKKDYRGGKVHSVVIKANEVESALGYFTVHKGWFLLASTPQPLYGFILRTKGDLPAWKADAKLLKQLEAFPKEFTAISVSDPRPTVQFLLAATPTVFSITNSVLSSVVAKLPGAPRIKSFDVSIIPHAQDATRHLFPNISVTTDEGKRIRSDTRASLAIPFLN